MKIRLNRLSLENFKGCKKREVFFNDMTKVMGANATGKTTLFDAFTWLLFNRDSLGSTQFDVRPKDADGNIVNHVEIVVEAGIRIDDVDYTLKKTQKQKWVKKRGTDTREFQGNVNEYEVNGYPKSEKEFKAFVGNVIDSNLFNLVTNPTAFTSLGWKDQREMLMKFVNTVSDVQIAEAYGERFAALISELKIASTDDILKKYTRAKKKLNEELIEIPARIDEVSKQLVIVDVGALQVELTAKEVELERIEDELTGDKSQLAKIEELRGHIMDLKFKASEIQNNASQELINAKSQVAEKISKYMSEMFSVEKELNELINLINKDKNEVERLEQERAILTGKWRELKNSTYPAYEPLPAYEPPQPLTDEDKVCPACGQELPKEVQEERIKAYEEACDKMKTLFDEKSTKHKQAYEVAKQEFITKRDSELEVVTKRGLEVKAKIEELSKVNGERLLTKTALEEKSQEMKTVLSEMETKRDNMVIVANMDDNAEYQEAMLMIERLEKQIEELNGKSAGNTELLARKAVVTDDISELKLKIKSADNTKVQERIAELEAEKKEIGQKLADVERMIDLTEEFVRVKMDRISGIVNEKFKIVSWKLFDNQINGGLKETCECTVNGVPYSSLNNGHRIVAGLDIVRSLAELYDVQAPVFVDNAEAISEGNLPEVETQMIAMYVSDSKELVVK